MEGSLLDELMSNARKGGDFKVRPGTGFYWLAAMGLFSAPTVLLRSSTRYFSKTKVGLWTCVILSRAMA